MTDYQQQATDFLAKHNIAFSFKLTNTKTPDWENNGQQRNHFVATLKQGKKRMSFDYFDSIKNFESGKTEITAYDALTICSSEINCPDSFEDFCGEFGYDEDSRKAEKTFRALKKSSDKLKKFFDTEEIRDDLSEIQ